MHRYAQTSLVIASILVVVLTLVSTGCGKTVGDTIDDATITTRVKTALLNDPDVGGLSIDVDTFQGVVTLSGRVKTVTEQDKAVRLARNTPGVTNVKNALQVLPETK